MTETNSHPELSLAKTSPVTTLIWNSLQWVLFAIGIAILATLVLSPVLGKIILWTILITAAPALFAIAPGLWRNICPMGFVSMIPDKLGISKGRKLSSIWQSRLYLIAVILLIILVPLRHIESRGWVIALVLFVVSLIALLAGALYERKSGWCSSLCPVYPVENLYGQKPVATVPNSHCDSCLNCVDDCSDTIPLDYDSNSNNFFTYKLAQTFMWGGFPGFVWGWFQVQDYPGISGWYELNIVFGYPLAGAVATLVLYVFAQAIIPTYNNRFLKQFFATATLSCYYWYRIPELFGYGTFSGQGMLVDLTDQLGPWFVIISRSVIIVLFIWLLIWRQNLNKTWTQLPLVIEQQ